MTESRNLRSPFFTGFALGFGGFFGVVFAVGLTLALAVGISGWTLSEMIARDQGQPAVVNRIEPDDGR